MWENLYQKRIYYVYLPLTVYWIFLFIMTSLPSQALPAIGVWDKFEHTGAYLVLSVLLYLTVSFQQKFPLLKKFPVISVIIIASLYAVLDELHQTLVPGRYCDIIDWLADLSGILAGVIICRIFMDKKVKNLSQSGIN